MGEQIKIIKLGATDSTNSYLKNLCFSDTPDDYTTVVAEYQKKGRGQQGNVWKSARGKNLTFSFLKRWNGLKIEDQFRITQQVSIGLVAALQDYNIPDLHIKWPNDILSGNQKIAGILLENIVQGSTIQHSIIGIGLNVNQDVFTDLDKAISMKLLLNEEFDLDSVLQDILIQMQNRLNLSNRTNSDYKEIYENQLYGKGALNVFRNKDGTTFSGKIQGVLASGKLRIQTEDEELHFWMKEIELVY